MRKTIIVTGGSSGIGLTTVTRLAAAGHRVYSASRSPGRTPLPDGATALVCDVGDASCADAVTQVVFETGRLDALVNNAATGELAAIEDGTDDSARQIVEVNLLGPMRLIRAAIPVMREQGGGHIVNVTSVNDTFSSPFIAWYDATKSGLAAASYALAAEVRQFGIKVSVVSPGLFRTDMTEGIATFIPPPDSHYRAALAKIATLQGQRMDRAGDPDVVGAAIQACIDSDDPPARVVVGDDAQTLLASGVDPNVYVPAMAEFVSDANR